MMSLKSKVVLALIILPISFTPSVHGKQQEPSTIVPNIIEPMCKKGQFSIIQKSTQSFRSYNGELCKIVPIAMWVLTYCKDNDENFKISDCKINAQFAVKNITPLQHQFASQRFKIDDAQDVSDLMELAKMNNVLTAKDMNIWQKYKIFFPKPSPKPTLHFKQ